MDSTKECHHAPGAQAPSLHCHFGKNCDHCFNFIITFQCIKTAHNSRPHFHIKIKRRIDPLPPLHFNLRVIKGRSCSFLCITFPQKGEKTNTGALNFQGAN